MNITSLVRKYGYKPELGTDLDKYETKLHEYLGREKYTLFWDLRHSENYSEDIIFRFIAEDPKLLKLIFSSQIHISISLAEYIFKVAHSKLSGSKSVLELGGADGWALDFLQKRYLHLSRLVNVESHTVWQIQNEKISQIQSTYCGFNSSEKFDLIFSILGSPLSNSEELLNCISRNLEPDGVALIATRLASENDFLEMLDNIHGSNLSIEPSSSSRITCGKERITVFSLSNEKSVITENEKLSYVREIFHLYEEVKRIFGIEARVIYDLIKDSELIEKYKKEFDDGWMQFELIKKNGIFYLYTTNYMNSKIIQFPYYSSFDFDFEIESCRRNDFWKNSL